MWLLPGSNGYKLIILAKFKFGDLCSIDCDVVGLS